jgi:hypothetical protein
MTMPLLVRTKVVMGTYYIGEINILGFKDVSWWHGFLHNGQFLLSALIQPHIWCARESFEANVDTQILVQDEHKVLVVPNDTVWPQISHVFISPIIYQYYW